MEKKFLGRKGLMELGTRSWYQVDIHEWGGLAISRSKVIIEVEALGWGGSKEVQNHKDRKFCVYP